MTSPPTDGLGPWRARLHARPDEDTGDGVFRAPARFDAERADAVAEAAGWAHWLVEGRAATKDELLDAFAAGCRFPSWFGRNWDALADSLRDLDLPDGRGALVWATAGPFAAAQPALWPTVRSILEGAVQFRREYGERLLVVCVGPTLPGLPDLGPGRS